MKKVLCLFFIIFFPLTLFSVNNYKEIDSYLLLKKANDSYKVEKYDEAKSNYLLLIEQFPSSKYVPYSLYMLSTMEDDYLKVIKYLFLIYDKYPDFEYWTNAVEKLGDVLYVTGKYEDALKYYNKIETENAIYMRCLILSSKKNYEKALEESIKLLSKTIDNRMAYKVFLLQIKIYFETKRYNEIYPILQTAIKIKNYAFDSGARLLFYIGKYYFIRNDIEKNYEKSLYAFSLLKKKFPMSIESTFANNYLSYLEKNNIKEECKINWVASRFEDLPLIPFKDDIVTSLEKSEAKVEKKLEEAEAAIGKAVKTDVLEYIVRIGEYKDLSVANMVAMDIGRNRKDIPVGVFFKNDRYYTEVRGIKDINEAERIAKILKAIGYTDTKVIELYRVIEYTE